MKKIFNLLVIFLFGGLISVTLYLITGNETLTFIIFFFVLSIFEFFKILPIIRKYQKDKYNDGSSDK